MKTLMAMCLDPQPLQFPNPPNHPPAFHAPPVDFAPPPRDCQTTPHRSSALPLIHTYADIDQLRPLTPAEGKLLEHCKSGNRCVLGDGKLPATKTPDREVRADLLRYLILGGCKDFRANGWGVTLSGAYISGALDLSFETTHKATGIQNCRFSEPFTAIQAKFKMLNLSGSSLPSINAQGAKLTGGAFLRGVTATGQISLSGAQIGGQLDCNGATFSHTQGNALNAEGAKITGTVFLDSVTAMGEVSLSGAQIGGQLACTGATFSHTQGDALNAEGAKITQGVFVRDVTATGEVSLSGAQIIGQLDCTGATFSATKGRALNTHSAKITGNIFLRGVTATGEVSLSGAQIGGQLDCNGATFFAKSGGALTLQSTDIREVFFWRNVTCREGILNFTAAHVGDLVDDMASWPEAGRLILDGFTYDRISGAATDAATRLAWLAKGSTWKGAFFPQPYTQLAKALRDMGHDSDARRVLAKREKLLHQFRRKLWRERSRRDPPNYVVALGTDIRCAANWIWERGFLNLVVGYGFHPLRSPLWLLALWVYATSLSHHAWEAGDFAPNSDVIQNSHEWVALAKSDAPNPAKAWSEPPTPQQAETRRAYVPGQDWATFNRYAYAADMVIPIINLGQTDAWAPSTERGPWGWRLWAASFVLTLAGWIVTALGAAAITGIIRRD